MKLAVLCFDDMVTIPGGRMLGDNVYGDACESQFTAADGWELHEVTTGIFSVRAPHMPQAMTIGGYGYRYLPAALEPALVAVETKRKR